MKLQPSTYILILALVAVLTGAVSLWLGVTTVLGNGKRLEANIVEVRSSELIDAQLLEYQDILENTVNDRSTLAGRILTEDKTITLLSRLEQIAEAKGVTIVAALNASDKPDEAFGILTASFKISGNENQVFEMLELLETLPYHSNVESVQLTRGRSTESGTTQADLSVQVQFTLAEYDE